jgi:hypothetical protein
MAKVNIYIYKEKKKVKRKGRHSKKKSSDKLSKNYKKPYRGQGR